MISGYTIQLVRKSKSKSARVFAQDIENLSKAPMKPQQRPFALRTMDIPGVYNQTALVNVLLGTSKSSGKMNATIVSTLT